MLIQQQQQKEIKIYQFDYVHSKPYVTRFEWRPAMLQH